MTSSDVEKVPDIRVAAQVATRQYEYDKSDLFTDWQRYCKVLRAEDRAVALLEGATFFAASVIPEIERQAWLPDSLNHLNSFKRLIQHSRGASENGQNARGRKRKRGIEQPDETIYTDIYMARMAEVGKLRDILGAFLFVGMKLSRARKREAEASQITLTDTVRLHLASQEGEDFKLAIWVTALTGEMVSAAKSTSVNELRDVLGDYLFEAMVASSKRRGEQMSICTSAVLVMPGSKDDDFKIEIMLCFGVGKEIYANMYPS
ncbi:hypothetical protein F4778DRAFT_697863 [Xylariomycetidae sp. FL2044]|nr:hypothetical protein F4778DRAFT_697863 [Xylariomycetidae sp. FL2044]